MKTSLLMRVAALAKICAIPGKERFLRAIYHPDRRQLNYFHGIIPYYDDLLIEVDTRDFHDWKVLFYGGYEPEICDLLRRIVRPNWVVFEVGANVGSHTLLLSRGIGESGRIFAFEPAPHVFELLCSNIALNRAINVVPLHVALAETAGEMTMHYSSGVFATEKMNSSFFPDSRLTQTTKVDVNTVDQLAAERGVQRMDLIKIDTEGNELGVLKGARATLTQYRPLLLFEYSRWNWNKAGYSWLDMHSLLQPLGYRYFNLCSGYLAPIAKEPPDDSDILAFAPAAETTAETRGTAI